MRIRNRLIRSCGSLAIMCLATFTCGVASHGQSFPIDKGYHEASRYCCRAIKEPNHKSLFSEDTSLSLIAAWSQLKAAVLVEKTSEDQPIGDHADRFLGFVEGRLNFDIPEWWEEQLRDGLVFDDQCNFGNDRTMQLWSESNRRLFSGVGDVLSTQDVVALHSGTRRVVLQRRDFRELISEVEDPSGTVLHEVAAIISDEHTFICFCGGFGPSTLSCVSNATGQVVWVTSVDNGSIPDRGYSGRGDGQYCELYLSRDSVVICGVNDIAMYLQVVSRTNGQTKVRFSTSYLDTCGDDGKANE